MDVYIIAGPNGAGKTTFARKFLPKYADCRNFINADLIAQGLAPFSPEAAGIRAGRLMISEIKLLAKRGVSFGFETTLAGRSYLKLIRDLKEKGYNIHIFFLWVANVEVALSRIQERVLKGGHDVPETEVRRRYSRSIGNFFQAYRELADSWSLFDNTGTRPVAIAFKKGARLRIMEREMYQSLVMRIGEK